MSDIHPQKDVQFRVGANIYTLRYSHMALVKLENQLNKSLVSVMNEISKPETMRLGTVVALLWAGLQKHHPKMTEDDAANLLDEIDGGFPAAVTIIDAAFGKAFGATPGTKGTNPPQKEGNGTGINSSSSLLVTGTLPDFSGQSRREN